MVTRADLPVEGIVIGPGAKTNWPPKAEGAAPVEAPSTPGTETWIHEACLVWLPNVCLFNSSRLEGMEEGVRECQAHVSSVCVSSSLVKLAF